MNTIYEKVNFTRIEDSIKDAALLALENCAKMMAEKTGKAIKDCEDEILANLDDHAFVVITDTANTPIGYYAAEMTKKNTLSLFTVFISSDVKEEEKRESIEIQALRNAIEITKEIDHTIIRNISHKHGSWGSTEAVGHY